MQGKQQSNKPIAIPKTRSKRFFGIWRPSSAKLAFNKPA
jgi:hypothetical protein